MEVTRNAAEFSYGISWDWLPDELKRFSVSVKRRKKSSEQKKKKKSHRNYVNVDVI